jgi:hypothetical protein
MAQADVGPILEMCQELLGTRNSCDRNKLEWAFPDNLFRELMNEYARVDPIGELRAAELEAMGQTPFLYGIRVVKDNEKPCIRLRLQPEHKPLDRPPLDRPSWAYIDGWQIHTPGGVISTG